MAEVRELMLQAHDLYALKDDELGCTGDTLRDTIP